MAEKNCSRCKVQFDCCNETRGCWCENYSLKEETLKQLKKDFDNCLCESCLKEFSIKAVKQHPSDIC